MSQVNTKSTRAVAYVRTSGEINPASSISNQISTVKEFASQNGLQLKKVFIDEKKTGTNNDRIAYQQMLNRVNSGTGEVILVAFLDRLGRESFSLIGTLQKLKDNNIEVIAVKQGMYLSKLRPIEMALRVIMCEEDNKRRKKRISDSKIDSIKKGEYIYTPPFGYMKNEERKLVINDGEAVMIKEVFRLFSLGKDISSIVSQFNQSREENKKWDYPKIRRILTNEKYSGIKVGNYLYPKIVEPDMFFHVQKKFNIGRKSSIRTKHFHLLSRKLVCYQCKQTMTAQTNTLNYRCSKCKKVKVKKRLVDEVVVNYFLSNNHEEGNSFENQSLIKSLNEKRKQLEKRFALGSMCYTDYQKRLDAINIKYESALNDQNELFANYSKELYRKLISASKYEAFKKLLLKDDELQLICNTDERIVYIISKEAEELLQY